jgi:hypothetical protein
MVMWHCEVDLGGLMLKCSVFEGLCHIVTFMKGYARLQCPLMVI